ncbi:MAG: phosphotransferase [Chloroflexi bacterium]|nr:phosphotransferase [Chloroflexota bacterium]
MPNLRELHELEPTLGELVLDLLRARFEYPELVLSPPLDARGEVSANAVRVTQHYTTALLAYGFASDQDELREAADWFATPFPNEAHRRIDAVEMNRLEALLSLCPDHPSVLPRLQQLLQQRTPTDYFDIQSSDLAFDTLWTIKVMALAREKGVLNGLMAEDDLRKWSNRMVQDTRRDKDLALALRLRHELVGRLTPGQQRKHLADLLRIAEQSGGLWGLSQDMMGIGQSIQQQALTVDLIADYREIFRETMLSTCYVIENLMPMLPAYPEVEPVVCRAMELWWGVFHGPNAVHTLRSLFPNPYDYLLIVSRTLVSLRAFLEHPLIRWGASYIHRKLAAQQVRQVEPTDTVNIKKALQNWIQVDLEKPPEQMRLGMSDSNVVRIRPRICNPMQPEDDTFRLAIPNADSLVVKYGPIDEIDAERDNYDKLPSAIKDCFVNIPQPSYVDPVKRRAYVIMADLNRYRTLYDALQKVPQIHEALVNELGLFLLRVHRGDGRPRLSTQDGLLMQLYLMPMQEHVRQVFSYILENRLLDSPDKQRYALNLQRTLLEMVGQLVRRQLDLETFPIACMHGDLHSRNIMVRRLKQRDSGSDSELDFKLIDLEKFRRNGDAAMDVGELLVDLELLRAPRNVAADRDPIVSLMRAIADTYTIFAREREDVNFSTRVQLAQARSLLRIAKGRTKQGELSLRESRKGPAIRVAFDALNDAEQALEYLKQVVAVLG